MRFTEEQTRALEARGTNLLLSAAAGSGKTAVLIERVLGLIREGADVDKMLVVTFTRAAAAEMRMRLSDGLSRLAAGGDERFREQMLKLDRAGISTLHGFCAEFLRANFEAAWIDPAFRILDDAEDRHLLDEAVADALEEAYARGGPSLEALDRGRGPARVRELCEALYAFLNERPDPEEWLRWAGDPARAPVEGWKDELSREARRAIDAAILNTRLALSNAGCPDHYARALGIDLEQLEVLRGLDTAEQLQAALTSFKQARPSGRLKDTDPAAVEEVKALRKAASDALKRAKLAAIPLRQGIEDALKLYDAYPALIEIARAIGEKHARGKEERLGLSYSDLERLALRALGDPNTAAGVREQYDYVFVDEYQDISDVQEALIERVSREDNLFVVGDVKQSIYRFRLAEPRLFLDRFHRYRRNDGGELLPLTRNFRSAHPVIDLVNAVFSRAMLGGDAEIVYDELARLNPGLPEREDAPAPEIILLDEGAGQEDEPDEEIEELGRAGREALLIANRIRALMDEDKNLRFRDIAILTRAKASAFNAMVPVLLAEGIPAYAEGLSGYFDAMEIAFVVSVLKLIDNFRSDTELIGALRSPMAGLSLEELSRIRLLSPEAAFCDAARAYAESQADETAEKLRAFFRMYDHWRLRAGSLALGELVRAVIDESGFYAYAGALPGGAQRQANLDRLVTRAERFDLEVSGSLTRFLAHAEHMRARGDGDSAQLLGENDDVVRLLTIHKSKGLEFPVVFGALIARRFRGTRSDEPLRAHRDLGIGAICVDPELRTRRVPLSYAAIAERIRREEAAEELRLLYVLMTRARDRLILTGSVRGADRAFARAAASAKLPSTATSHLQIVLGAVLSADEGERPAVEISVRAAGELRPSGREDASESARAAVEAALRGELGEPDERALDAMAWEYPHAADTERPLKLTASGLLREVEGPWELPELAKRPEFLREGGALTATERGSAYHRALEALALKPLRGLSGAELRSAIKGQLDDLRLANRLTASERAAVLPGAIARFFEGNTGRRILESGTVMREWPFNVEMKVSEAIGDEAHERFGGEVVLVQGTVDLCFVEGGEWVLIDYKTDSARDREALRSHYERQLGVYALALERITGMRVKERILCLLAAGEEISL